MTIQKFTLVCIIALLSTQAIADEKHITIIKPLQQRPPDVSMHLGPAIYSDKDWHAERMPIKVKYKPINDKRILPPAEFDHEFDGAVVITRVDEQGIKKQCPTTLTGCAFLWRQTCYMWIVCDDILNYQRYSYDVVLRHEIAHCNGWHHDQNGKTISAKELFKPETDKLIEHGEQRRKELENEGRTTPQKKLEGWCVVDPSLWMCRND